MNWNQIWDPRALQSVLGTLFAVPMGLAIANSSIFSAELWTFRFFAEPLFLSTMLIVMSLACYLFCIFLFARKKVGYLVCIIVLLSGLLFFSVFYLAFLRNEIPLGEELRRFDRTYALLAVLFVTWFVSNLLLFHIHRMARK